MSTKISGVIMDNVTITLEEQHLLLKRQAEMQAYNIGMWLLTNESWYDGKQSIAANCPYNIRTSGCRETDLVAWLLEYRQSHHVTIDAKQDIITTKPTASRQTHRVGLGKLI